MSEERWIVVRNWDRFQHYKDRRPVWIKLYPELLHDEEYRGLSLSQSGMLAGLWMLYADSRGVLSETRARQELGRSAADARRVREHLISLNDAGFIDIVASKPPPFGYARERERERDRPLSISLPNAEPEKQREETPKSQNRGNGWVENLSSYTGCRYVRGTHALTAVHDPLGTEPPPIDWPYPRPTRDEIAEALSARDA